MKLIVTVIFCAIVVAQDTTHQHAAPAPIPLQPLALQVRQLEEAMNYLGQPFGAADLRSIHEAIARPDETTAVHALESILDAHVLLTVDINPESRVKVEEGTAKPELVEAGTRLFLVKIINNGHVRAPLVVQSPNSGDVYVRSNGNPAPPIQLSPQEAKERWAKISLYQRAPMRARLSGLALEYAILEIYSRDAGQRSAKISFNVGQGSQDIGFRNDTDVELFARSQGPRAAEHGVLDLLEGIANEALRRPASLVEHVDEQVELGLAVNPAVSTNALDQPLHILGGEVALGFGLLDKVIGNGLHKALSPGRILHGTGIVQGKNDVGLFGRNATIVAIIAAQLEDVGILDATARLNLRDRNRVQYCHSQPPANRGQS